MLLDDTLVSSLDRRFPSVYLGDSSTIGLKGLGSTREVGNGLTPPLLGLKIHFSRRLLSDTTQPHMPKENYNLVIQNIQTLILKMLPFRCKITTVRLITGIFDPTLTA